MYARLYATTPAPTPGNEPVKPATKPPKPTPNFPLFPHATGQWAKKIKGRLMYFGPWDNPAGALARYNKAIGSLPGRTEGPKSRPAKPYRDFPLYPHARGQWAKKIRGRTHYFGPISDPQAALNRYLDARDDLAAGRDPVQPDGLTVVDLANAFINSKALKAKSGEISKRTVVELLTVCKRVVEVLGESTIVEALRPM